MIAFVGFAVQALVTRQGPLGCLGSHMAGVCPLQLEFSALQKGTLVLHLRTGFSAPQHTVLSCAVLSLPGDEQCSVCFAMCQLSCATPSLVGAAEHRVHAYIRRALCELAPGSRY